MLYGVVSLILPENILDQFDIVKLEDEDINRHDGTYQPFKHNVHIYLDEQDNRTAEPKKWLLPNNVLSIWLTNIIFFPSFVPDSQRKNITLQP